MDKTWVCELCYDEKPKNSTNNSSEVYEFASQEDLIRHITHHHLSKKIESGHTVFICTYVVAIVPLYNFCSQCQCCFMSYKTPVLFV